MGDPALDVSHGAALSCGGEILNGFASRNP